MSVFCLKGKDIILLYLFNLKVTFKLRFQFKQTTTPIYKKLIILILLIISHQLGKA